MGTSMKWTLLVLLKMTLEFIIALSAGQRNQCTVKSWDLIQLSFIAIRQAIFPLRTAEMECEQPRGIYVHPGDVHWKDLLLELQEEHKVRSLPPLGKIQKEIGLCLIKEKFHDTSWICYCIRLFLSTLAPRG